MNEPGQKPACCNEAAPSTVALIEHLIVNLGPGVPQITTEVFLPVHQGIPVPPDMVKLQIEVQLPVG